MDMMTAGTVIIRSKKPSVFPAVFLLKMLKWIIIRSKKKWREFLKKMGKFLHSNYVMGTENMEILKVVIADDEVRICQLIQALIDWDSMGMKVVGVAHNGEEACEMVRQTQPDILITDIRMPGCSGTYVTMLLKKTV